MRPEFQMFNLTILLMLAIVSDIVKYIVSEMFDEY